MQTSDAIGAAASTIAQMLASLGADDKRGLTDAEVQARLEAVPGQTRSWRNRKTRSPRYSLIFGDRFRGCGFAAGVAKLGATLGVFLLPILKQKFGVPSVLGIVSAVSCGSGRYLDPRTRGHRVATLRVVEMARESDTFHRRCLWKYRNNSSIV